MTNPTTPQGFLNVPGYGSQRPQPTPPSRTQEPRTGYITPGPGNTAPLLSVGFPNFLTLTKPLLAVLGLSKMGSSRVHLVVPAQIGGDWYLDTQPKPGMGTHFPERGRARVRIQQVSKMHFGERRPLFASEPGKRLLCGNANVFVTLLHFRLGEEVEGHPGYYRLHRVSRAVHH